MLYNARACWVDGLEFSIWTSIFQRWWVESCILFLVFANIYHVKVTTFGKQRFLKCNCLHYERCGIPCSHILKITDEIEEMMIKIQHLKVYQVDYGNMDSNLSSKLMQGSSLQTSYEDMGMPLLNKCLDKALNPRESLWVTLSGICTFTSFEL